jgi:hypothetical protein
MKKLHIKAYAIVDKMVPTIKIEDIFSASSKKDITLERDEKWIEVEIREV